MSITPPPPNPFGADALGNSANGHHHGNLGRQAAATVAINVAKHYGPRIIKALFGR